MLDIIYEEGPCLGINKPSGLLTQAPHDIDSLERRVKAYLMETENRGENGYLGIPHRLDRVASGVILFGKHSRATRRLSEQFQARTIEKTYWACAQGVIEPDEETWIDYVRKISNVPRAEIVPPIDPDAREAILHYKVLGRFHDFTWLEIRLETGRMHQIRIQAASRGNPLLGDSMYGSQVPFGPQFEDERLRAVALHARMIRFTHPMTRDPVELTASLPLAWHEIGIEDSR